MQVHNRCTALENEVAFPTQGPSWGYLKVNYSEILPTSGDEWMQVHNRCTALENEVAFLRARALELSTKLALEEVRQKAKARVRLLSLSLSLSLSRSLSRSLSLSHSLTQTHTQTHTHCATTTRPRRRINQAKQGAVLSDSVHLLIRFRKPTPSQNRQLVVYYY